MNAVNKKSALAWLKEGGIYVVLMVLLAIIIIQDPTFLSLMNLSNILTQSSVRVIIALGVAGLIVTRGPICPPGVRWVWPPWWPPRCYSRWITLTRFFRSWKHCRLRWLWRSFVPLALVGLVNGMIIACLKVTPFITTLGTMIIVYGVNSFYYDHVGASPVAGFDEKFSTFVWAFCALATSNSLILPSTR